MESIKDIATKGGLKKEDALKLARQEASNAINAELEKICKPFSRKPPFLDHPFIWRCGCEYGKYFKRN